MFNLIACVLCNDGVEETIDHLFFECDFAKKCWDKLGIQWVNDDDIHRKIERSNQLAGLSFFMEIFSLLPGSSGKSGIGWFFMEFKFASTDGLQTSRRKLLFNPTA